MICPNFVAIESYIPLGMLPIEVKIETWKKEKPYTTHDIF